MALFIALLVAFGLLYCGAKLLVWIIATPITLLHDRSKLRRRERDELALMLSIWLASREPAVEERHRQRPPEKHHHWPDPL